MKFEPFIIEKLFKGEPVKVQGLGEFRPVEKKTSIHPGDHQFDPPGRSLEFDYNPDEKDNGLLAYIAESTNESQQNVFNELDKRVEEIKKDLKAGKRVQLYKIGFLHYDFRGQVQLDADQSVNYSKEFYGLPRFQGELITSASTTSEKPKETTEKVVAKPQQNAKKKAEAKTPKPKQQKKPKPKQPRRVSEKKKTKKEGKKTAAWLIPVVLLIVIGAAAWYLQDEWKPLFEDDKTTAEQPQKAEEAENIAAADTMGDSKLSGQKDSVIIDSAKQEPVKETKPESPKQTQTASASQGDYIIIAGCFRSQENAHDFVEELKQKGYEASIQGKTPQGLHRVVYGVYSHRRNALNALNKIHDEENSGAWLDRY